MAFNANDIYVAGGKDKIYNIWTPGVRKFDSNSFYNWEEDNVPIYDLEDRTYYLWEKFGSQSSSVDGAVLTVSADASAHVVNATTGETAYDLDPNIFLDVSSAIAAIPEVLRYPIRVEICNFGSLGSLNLNNIKLMDRGALEIVNRNFAKIDLGTNRTGCRIQDGATIVGATTGVPTNIFASGVSSIDLTQMLSASAGLGISALELSTTLTSGINDQRFVASGCAWFFLQQAAMDDDPTSDTVRRASTMTVGTPNATFKPTTYVFGMQPYDHEDDTTITTYDQSSIAHPTNDSTTLRLNREGYNAEQMTGGTDMVTSNNISTGLFYGNYLNNINIQNCDGPIYVRNMHVNGTNPTKIGASLTSYDTEIGIKINNSDVVLENSTSWRCNEAGIEINNSKVNLNRGCVAYRNYRYDDRANDTSGAGLKIFNSHVTVSSGYESSGSNMLFSFNRNTNGVIIDNSILTGGYWRREVGTTSSVGTIQAYENNIDGFKISNSRLSINGKIEAWENTNGFNLTNSNLECDELESEYNQEIGMKLKSSHFLYGKNLLPVAIPAANNKELRTQSTEGGVAVTNQIFGETIDFTGQFHFHWNGVHLVMDNSTFKYKPMGIFKSPYFDISRSKFKLNFKRATTAAGVSAVTVPGIQIRNNSQGKFLQTAIFTEGIQDNGEEGLGTYVGGLGDPASGVGYGTGTSTSGTAGTGSPAYGSCISAKHNSTAEFFGTDKAITHLDGPEFYFYQKYGALACAEDNSTLRFSGPTLMIRGGIDALAEDNSKIIFEPPTDDSGYIDLSGFALSGSSQAESNHTKVDLHSSRACLVANRNSEIIMHDLGDYSNPYKTAGAEMASWNGGWSSDDNGGVPESITTPSGITSFTNYSTYSTSASTHFGHMQFYPNPQLQYDATVRPPYNPGVVSGPGGASEWDFSKGNIYDTQNLPLIDATPSNALMSDKSTMYGLSMGGMCVRAMKGSSVNVRNVNFPCGWENTSGYYYDYTVNEASPATRIRSAANQLRIWNVDGTSELDASFLLVSGIHPTLAGEKAPYYGPPAWYSSPGTEGTADETCLSGAPSSTINSNSSSVLDPYGRLPRHGTKSYQENTQIFGDTTVSTVGFNTGPFRLYYSPVQYAKHMTTQVRGPAGLLQIGEASSVLGDNYQMISQGYNPSQSCSGIQGGPPSIYTSPITSSMGKWGMTITADPYVGHGGYQGIAPVFANASLNLPGTTNSDGDNIAPAGKWMVYSDPYSASVGYLGQHYNSEDYAVTNQTQVWINEGAGWTGVGAPGARSQEADHKRRNFFWCKDLLPRDYWTRIRMDESGAAVWANAKSGALGGSYRGRHVTIYDTTTQAAGQGAQAYNPSGADLAQGFGMGFLSSEEFDLRRQD